MRILFPKKLEDLGEEPFMYQRMTTNYKGKQEEAGPPFQQRWMSGYPLSMVTWPHAPGICENVLESKALYNGTGGESHWDTHRPCHKEALATSVVFTLPF